MLKGVKKKFRGFTGLLKDCSWWMMVIFAPLAYYFGITKAEYISYILRAILPVIIIYFWIRAWSYRKSQKELQRSFHYTHMLMHDMRDNLGEELESYDLCLNSMTEGEAYDSIPEQVIIDAEMESVEKSLCRVLDHTANCFRDLTGAKCTAVLILLEEGDNIESIFASQFYNRDTDTKRIEGSERQVPDGMAQAAFEASGVTHMENLNDELAKGRFKPHRKDWQKWYQSAMMAHFRVKGEKWGLLCVDSPDVKTFHSSHDDILCTFADSCGLLFELYYLDSFGYRIYEIYGNQNN